MCVCVRVCVCAQNTKFVSRGLYEKKNQENE